MEKARKSKWIWAAVTAVAGTAAVACGDAICQINRFYTALLLVALAVAVYFIQVFCVADRNWLDIRAVFSGVWLGTLGLAALRLTAYQEPWQAKTWILLGAAYGVFQLGVNFGLLAGQKWFPAVREKAKGVQLGRLRFKLHEERLFWICIVTTTIGFICFAINVAIRGYIPCFSNDTAAYVEFYTRFHVFAVASVGVSGLCYYCIATQKLSIFKKILLGLCILHVTFLFPIMVVSRGTFIVSAVSLMVVVFYLHGRKLWVLLLSLAVILGVYSGASFLRGYTDAQLSYFFEPEEVTLSEEDDPDEEIESGDVDFGDISFTLSPKLSFVYSYLTVSHDNFNEAVENTTGYTYGARQLAPLNVLLRIDRLNEIKEEGEFYKVRPHLNTNNLIGDFYYDFHELGVVLCMAFWAFIFGILQSCCIQGKGPFFVMVMGNTMVPVMLCFFSSWLSNFTQWMLWGVILLFAIAAGVTLAQKKQK